MLAGSVRQCMLLSMSIPPLESDVSEIKACAAGFAQGAENPDLTDQLRRMVSTDGVVGR